MTFSLHKSTLKLTLFFSEKKSTMKKFTVSLLALGAIGFIAVPVHARPNDEAVIQDARQESYIYGNDNTSIQRSTQINHNRNNRRTRNSGVVQTSDQYSDVAGDGNYNRQTIRQGNMRYEGRKPRYR